MSRADDIRTGSYEPTNDIDATGVAAESTYVDPTQRLSDVKGLNLFPD
jgi:hypothetical protein